MAMSNRIRRELAKSRELLDFALEGQTCFFCGEPLVTRVNAHKHGDGVGSPLAVRLTIHHKDGDHTNDARDNKALAHTACHKAHHAREILHTKARLPVCDNCAEPHPDVRERSNGSAECDRCWRASLEHGHVHGLHTDLDGAPEDVADCPLCPHRLDTNVKV
jgi:hypothetical protein